MCAFSVVVVVVVYQLLAVNEKESRNNDLENMKKGLRNTYKFTLRVKSNLPEYRWFVAMPKAEVRSAGWRVRGVG